MVHFEDELDPRMPAGLRAQTIGERFGIPPAEMLEGLVDFLLELATQEASKELVDELDYWRL